MCTTEQENLIDSLFTSNTIKDIANHIKEVIPERYNTEADIVMFIQGFCKD